MTRGRIHTCNCWMSAISKKSTPPGSAGTRCRHFPMFPSLSKAGSLSRSWGSPDRARPHCSTSLRRSTNPPVGRSFWKADPCPASGIARSRHSAGITSALSFRISISWTRFRCGTTSICRWSWEAKSTAKWQTVLHRSRADSGSKTFCPNIPMKCRAAKSSGRPSRGR